MASGKRNYFRHSFNARNDDFIIGLINTFKEKGYFMWFALIEVCAELVSDGQHLPVRLNQSRLYRELRCTEGTLKAFLTYLEARSKVRSTYLEGTYEIEVINLPKYMGKYSEISPNKIKGNKRKGKETKENKSSTDVGAIDVFLKNQIAVDLLATVPKKVQSLWVKTYSDNEWILFELVKAANWMEANKSKAPKSDFKKFLNGWLTRSWDQHRKTIPAQSSKQSHRTQSAVTPEDLQRAKELGIL